MLYSTLSTLFRIELKDLPREDQILADISLTEFLLPATFLRRIKLFGLFPFDNKFESFECYIEVVNPSSRTMALGFTQPLTEMSTRN
jgi:hypothetical protein